MGYDPMPPILWSTVYRWMLRGDVDFGEDSQEGRDADPPPGSVHTSVFTRGGMQTPTHRANPPQALNADVEGVQDPRTGKRLQLPSKKDGEKKEGVLSMDVA